MSHGPERIAAAFEGGGTAFMPYMMGGYPTLEESLKIGEQYIAGGADLIELGIPFSDPLADGPAIHAAGTQALRAGATVEGVLGICKQMGTRIPVVVMTYANIVMAQGAAAFAQRLVDAGAAGLIVPDLPLEESDEIRAACEKAAIAFVPLVAPTTTDERLKLIGKHASGFLYAVSVVGTTGERAKTDAYNEVIGRAKQHAKVPVALGFGVSSPDQAVIAANAGADGVIVGTRMIRAVADGEDVQALVGDFAKALAST
jgi:tryptophan synthase alpha chain